MSQFSSVFAKFVIEPDLTGSRQHQIIIIEPHELSLPRDIDKQGNVNWCNVKFPSSGMSSQKCRRNKLEAAHSNNWNLYLDLAQKLVNNLSRRTCSSEVRSQVCAFPNNLINCRVDPICTLEVAEMAEHQSR
jgi:hypothetical protein